MQSHKGKKTLLLNAESPKVFPLKLGNITNPNMIK
jgi:hypothetical protein